MQKGQAHTWWVLGLDSPHSGALWHVLGHSEEVLSLLKDRG